MPKIDIRTSVMSDRRAVAARNQDIFRDRERSSAQNWKQSKSANQKIDRKKTGSSWNRVGKFEGLKGHRARYFRDILHFCGVQNLAQMLDGKNIETSSAALGYVFI
jgi:hypothetical protein